MKCPYSVCHINIYSPKQTARRHNVDNIVVKANNLKPFKLQILFTCAAQTPLISLKLHSVPCSGLFDWSLSNCSDKANKYNQPFLLEDIY